MNVVYYTENPPSTYSKSIFLAGPTARDGGVSWRTEAIQTLESLHYDGVVFVPEFRPNIVPEGYSDWIKIVEWEEQNLNRADCILFWIPRDMSRLPGLTTNDEFGFWKGSGKVVLGCPLNAEKTRYQIHYAQKYNIPTSHMLEETIRNAISFVGDGAERSGGERDVPVLVYKHPTFQKWLASQKLHGNKLEWAKVKWVHRSGKGPVFMWIVHAGVWIAAEKRAKVNEFVVGRTDMASAVLVYPSSDSDPMLSKIVLVREFRTPVRNSEGFVFDLPGGSSFNPDKNMEQVIASEIEEETGVKIDPSRLVEIGSRQVASTLLAHTVTSYYATLSLSEIESFEAQYGIVHGIEKDSERTFVEVITLKEALTGDKLDWTTAGQILMVVNKVFNSEV